MTLVVTDPNEAQRAQVSKRNGWPRTSPQPSTLALYLRNPQGKINLSFVPVQIIIQHKGKYKHFLTCQGSGNLALMSPTSTR